MPFPRAEKSVMQRKILLIEDKPLTRTGLYVVLSKDPSLCICCERKRPEAVLNTPDCFSPNLILLDVACKNGGQVTLLRQLRKTFPETPLVVIAGRPCLRHADAALQSGVRGYLLNTDPPERLIQALHRVLDGGLFVSPAVNQQLLTTLVDRRADDTINPMVALSLRELQVFEQTGQGHSTVEIADAMHISPKTVDTYRRRIRQKLHLRSHTAFMQHALSWWVEHNGLGADRRSRA